MVRYLKTIIDPDDMYEAGIKYDYQNVRGIYSLPLDCNSGFFSLNNKAECPSEMLINQSTRHHILLDSYTDTSTRSDGAESR
jgi:hypothetical protein